MAPRFVGVDLRIERGPPLSPIPTSSISTRQRWHASPSRRVRDTPRGYRCSITAGVAMPDAIAGIATPADGFRTGRSRSAKHRAHSGRRDGEACHRSGVLMLLVRGIGDNGGPPLDPEIDPTNCGAIGAGNVRSSAPGRRRDARLRCGGWHGRRRWGSAIGPMRSRFWSAAFICNNVKPDRYYPRSS